MQYWGKSVYNCKRKTDIKNADDFQETNIQFGTELDPRSLIFLLKETDYEFDEQEEYCCSSE